MRVGCILALAIAGVAAGPTPRPAGAIAMPNALPAATAASGAVLRAALNFSVSVCLADFEYAIGCRERSSLEAARRLEQIYLDDYATGIPAGSLRIWFAVKAEPGEQTAFLHEVENRAIESVFRKLQEDAQHRAAGTAGSGAAGDDARAFADEIRHWHDDATAEARSGANWSHDWSARTHGYKAGEALRELARLGNRSRQDGD